MKKLITSIGIISALASGTVRADLIIGCASTREEFWGSSGETLYLRDGDYMKMGYSRYNTYEPGEVKIWFKHLAPVEHERGKGELYVSTEAEGRKTTFDNKYFAVVYEKDKRMVDENSTTIVLKKRKKNWYGKWETVPVKEYRGCQG